MTLTLELQSSIHQVKIITKEFDKQHTTFKNSSKILPFAPMLLGNKTPKSKVRYNIL